MADKADKMETRSGANRKDQPLNEHELLLVQKQQREKEKRLHEESERVRLEAEALRRAQAQQQSLQPIQSSVSQDNVLEALLREIKSLRSDFEDIKSNRIPPSEAVTSSPPHFDQDPPILIRQPSLTPIDQRLETFASNVSHTNPNNVPQFSLKETVNSVPPFDGSNIPVYQYIRAARRARDSLPTSTEPMLTRLLINRLKDDAYLAVEDEDCDTITKLCDVLRVAFGKSKTLHEHRAELASTYQYVDEGILKYIGRVKDARAAVLDSERDTTGNVTLSVQDDLDKLTLKCFVKGLLPQIRTEMNSPTNLKLAFAQAREISRQCDLDKERADAHKNLLTATRRTNPLDSVHNRSPGKQVPRSPCGHCGRSGHASVQCWHRSDRPRHNEANGHHENNYRDNSNRRYSSNNRSRPDDFSGTSNPPRYSNSNHSQNNSSRRNNYYNNDGPRFNNDPPRQSNYRQPSNNYSQPSNNYQRTSNNQNDAPTCNYCKGIGHLIQDCRKREYYNNLRNANSGNASRSPSQSGLTQGTDQNNPNDNQQQNIRTIVAEPASNEQPESQPSA